MPRHRLTLAPAALIALYFVVGLIAFTARTAVWGLSHDRDIEASGRYI